MAERLSQAEIDAGVADTRKQVEDALARAQTQIAEHWVWYLPSPSAEPPLLDASSSE